MSKVVIVDSSPLIALIDDQEQDHEWCREQFRLLRPPLLSCEAVISEACFLLGKTDRGVNSLMQLLERGVVTTPFRLADESVLIARLLARYRSVPMSLADACLVRMAEQHAGSVVFTLDHDFRIYRKSGRAAIPTLMPN